MLPTARPQSPARVRVGWLPFAGISLPGAEALRLFAMDYERDALVPAPDMPSAPGGSRGPIHPSHPDVMPPNSQPSYLPHAKPSCAPEIGAKPGNGHEPKGREVTDHARNALKQRTVGAARPRSSGGPP